MKKGIKKFLRGIMVFLILIILSVILVYVFRNPIAEFFIEKSGETVAGAKVEVEGVDIKPLSLHITWDKYQFTDKNKTMENLFETGNCEFALELKPLLAGKVLIDKMTLKDLKFGTERATDGKLPPGKKRKQTKFEKDLKNKVIKLAKEKLEEEKQGIPVFNSSILKTKIDVDSVIAAVDLQTPAKAEELKQLYETRYDHWNDKLDNNTYEADINKIKSDLKKIDVDKIKTLDDFQTNLTLVQSVYSKSNEVYSNVTTDKKELEKDLKTLKQLKNDVPEWIESDYKKALSFAKLPDINVENVALMLFGDKITNGLMMILDNIQKSRDLAASAKSEPSKDEKMPELPKLWIRLIELNLETKDGMALAGNIRDVTENQDKTSQPMLFTFTGSKANLGDLQLIAKIDYRNSKSQEDIVVKLDDMPVSNMKFANFDLLPSKLEKGNSRLNATVNMKDDEFKSKIFFAVDDVEFDYASKTDMNKDLVRVSREITEAIDVINVNARVKQIDDDFSMNLDSNLDELIASKLKQIISGEIQDAKDEIERRVRAEVDGYKKELTDIVAAKEAELRSKIAVYEQEINKQKAAAEKKKQEVKDKIEKEKKKLEQQAQDKLEEGVDDLLDKLKF